jgi:hypothetical protein
MPTTSGYDGVCILPNTPEQFPITDGNSYKQCTDAGGVYRPLTPDAGKRVSGFVLGEQLRVEGRNDLNNPFSNRKVSARLLLFPICEVHRRAPTSRFLAKVDLLDRNFTDELNRLLADDEDLRMRVSQLVLDASWVAARALSEESANADGGPVVSDELVARGRELGEEIQSRTEDKGLIAAIRDAVEFSEELRGVAVSEVVAILARRHHR